MAGLDAGSYVVLANVKYITGAAGVYARQQFGEWTAVTTSALKFLPLGVVSLPTAAVRGAETDTLSVSIKGDDTNYAAVNYVALLPVSDGLIGYVPASGHVHTLRWADGSLYADDAAELAGSLSGAIPLSTLGGQLLLLAETATAAPTTTVALSDSRIPRWEQLPSGGVIPVGPGPGI